jgi:putative oxidoreductase
MALDTMLSQQAPRYLSIFRIVFGLMFLAHGTSKFFGFPPRSFGLVAFPTLIWFQGLIELIGGGLLTAGLFTRAVAFILAGDMAVAYFMSHAPKGFFPHVNGGSTAVLYCFAFLYFFFAGGGTWSLDRFMRKTSD